MRSKRMLLPIAAAALVLVAADAALAGEVYRWVDEDGVVHFSDSAEGIKNAERVNVPAASTGRPDALPPTIAPATAPEAEPQPSLAQQRRNERAEARQKAAEERRLVEAACAEARKRVATLEPSTKVLVEDEDGTVRRLDDDKRLELLDEAKAYVARNCSN